MTDQSRRTWAIIMLITFLLGVGLAVYSFIIEQNTLGLTGGLFMLFGGIGAYVLRRDLDEKHREEAQTPEEGASEEKAPEADAADGDAPEGEADGE